MLLLLEANEIGQAFVEGGGFNAEASCCRKDEGGEDTVLDLVHSAIYHWKLGPRTIRLNLVTNRLLIS